MAFPMDGKGWGGTPCPSFGHVSYAATSPSPESFHCLPTPPTASLSLRRMTSRSRKGLLRASQAGDGVTPADLPARIQSISYQSLVKTIPVSQLPSTALLPLRHFAQTVLEAVTESPETFRSDLGLYSSAKIQQFVASNLPIFTTPLIAQLVAERDDPSLYPVPAVPPPTCRRHRTRRSKRCARCPPAFHANFIRRFVEACEHSEQGKRASMEDKVIVIPHLSNLLGDSGVATEFHDDERLCHPALPRGSPEMWERATQVFTGVYDGHMGREAAVYAKMHLHHHLRDALRSGLPVQGALEHAFVTTHKNFLARAQELECDAGTTATVALCLGRTVWVANVGDTSGVVCKNGSPQRVTTMHHVSNGDEVAAVVQRGGEIVRLRGLRVDGHIQVTRTLGFRPAHHHLTAVPDVTSFEVDKDTEFLVIATDGLWDVMSPEEVVAFVRQARAEVDANIASKMNGTPRTPVPGTPGTPASLAPLPSQQSIPLIKVTTGTRTDQGDADVPVPTPSTTYITASTATPHPMFRADSFLTTAITEGVPHDDSDPMSSSDTDESDSDSDDNEERRYVDYRVVAEALVAEAVSLGTTDNVSASILFFNTAPPTPAP